MLTSLTTKGRWKRDDPTRRSEWERKETAPGSGLGWRRVAGTMYRDSEPRVPALGSTGSLRILRFQRGYSKLQAAGVLSYTVVAESVGDVGLVWRSWRLLGTLASPSRAAVRALAAVSHPASCVCAGKGSGGWPLSTWPVTRAAASLRGSTGMSLGHTRVHGSRGHRSHGSFSSPQSPPGLPEARKRSFLSHKMGKLVSPILRGYRGSHV